MGIKNKEVNDLAEKIFLKKSGLLQPHTDQNAKGNVAIIENCFTLAEVFIKIKDERADEE